MNIADESILTQSQPPDNNMTIARLPLSKTMLSMEWADMCSSIASMRLILPGCRSAAGMLCRLLLRNTSGNSSLFAALVMTIVVTGLGASIDFHAAYVQRNKMQQSLDAAVLVAVKKSTLADQ